MREHVFPVLIIIVLVPVWTISLIWKTIVHNENDAINYRFEKILEQRLGDFVTEASIKFKEIEQDILQNTNNLNASTSLKNENPLFLSSILVGTTGKALEGSDSKFIDISEKIADSILNQKINETDFLSLVDQGRVEDIKSYQENKKYGWRTVPDRAGFRLFFWKKTAADNLAILEINREIIFDLLMDSLSISESTFKDAVVLADEYTSLFYLRGDDTLVKKQENLKAFTPLEYPLHVFKMYYFTQDIPAIDLEMRFIILSVAFSLMLLGGYYFFEHMRTVDDTVKKVSFVNQVSHELKTPLTNIRMYAELLKSTCGDDQDTIKKLDIIDSESARLSRLIHNVLAFSNPDKLDPRPVPTDIEKLIEKILQGFALNLESKKIDVDLDLNAAEHLVDPDMLEQILVNLISNVEKYAYKGGYLGIKTFKEDDKLHIRVKDKGEGIPEKLTEAIFKPFVRGKNHISEGVSGTGIGLALAKDLATRHGGSLHTINENEGACFEVIL